MDLGVVDSRTQKDDTAARLTVKGATSLHAAIREINPEVLGVDVDREGIDILSGQDFNVRVADVLTMQLGEEFETIIAGDIIEHLDNAGLFLRNVAEHLTGDGVLLYAQSLLYQTDLEDLALQPAPGSRGTHLLVLPHNTEQSL